jgi:hypothetical protein
MFFNFIGETGKIACRECLALCHSRLNLGNPLPTKLKYPRERKSITIHPTGTQCAFCPTKKKPRGLNNGMKFQKLKNSSRDIACYTCASKCNHLLKKGLPILPYYLYGWGNTWYEAIPDNIFIGIQLISLYFVVMRACSSFFSLIRIFPFSYIMPARTKASLLQLHSNSNPLGCGNDERKKIRMTRWRV